MSSPIEKRRRRAEEEEKEAEAESKAWKLITPLPKAASEPQQQQTASLTIYKMVNEYVYDSAHQLKYECDSPAPIKVVYSTTRPSTTVVNNWTTKHLLRYEQYIPGKTVVSERQFTSDDLVNMLSKRRI